MWYYRFAGHTLKDSRFGTIAPFQRALSAKLTSAGHTGVTDDGSYGRRTRDAIVQLCTLPEFASLNVPETDPHFGAISFSLWERLMSGASPPTVRERAFVLSLTHEGTDYDKAEWNLGTSDHASVLTWGPYGATVGHGREVQAVLRRILERQAQVVSGAFGPEFAVLRQLLDGSAGETFLAPVHADPARRQAWVQAFATLGEEPIVREEYEAFAFATNEWMRPPVKRLYQGLIPGANVNATAVDYGFFLDLAMHMSITQARIDSARTAILAKEQELGRPLRPADRRRVISSAMIPSQQQADRLGRNVVYFVDAVGEAGLTVDERSAWQQRTGRRASDCGLMDDERFFPDFLV